MIDLITAALQFAALVILLALRVQWQRDLDRVHERLSVISHMARGALGRNPPKG